MKKKIDITHQIDAVVISNFVSPDVPLPCKVFFRPKLKTTQGRSCILFVGLIPLDITDIKDDDVIMSGKVLFLPDKAWKNKKYYGWLIEDILRDGTWVLPKR